MARLSIDFDAELRRPYEYPDEVDFVPCACCGSEILAGEKYYNFGEPICTECVEHSATEVDESFTCEECEEYFIGKDGMPENEYWKYDGKCYCEKCIKEFEDYMNFWDWR